MIGRWENHLSATWEFQHKCKHKNNKRQLIIKLYYEEGDGCLVSRERIRITFAI